MKQMINEMYFVPFNPEDASKEDWEFLNSQSWIDIENLDVSNFYDFYYSLQLGEENNQYYFYSPFTIEQIENEYKDNLKNAIREFSVYFTTLKYITFTEEFADSILESNSVHLLGDSGKHYYYSPYQKYSQKNINYNEGSINSQAKVNPMELLLEIRNISYNLSLIQKPEEWIYYDFKENNLIDFSESDLKNFDSSYKNVYGFAGAPSNPVITIDWNPAILSNPDLLSNIEYSQYLSQRKILFGSEEYESSFQNTPNYLDDGEIIPHEITHNLGYKHSSSDTFKDATYWMGETYDEIYNEEFYSDTFDRKVTLSDWFLNSIYFSSEQNWEEYNLYYDLWNYSNNELGDVNLINYYNN